MPDATGERAAAGDREPSTPDSREAPTPAGRAFTGMALDRATLERKDPSIVERLWQDPSARAVVAGADGVLVGPDDALLRVPLPDSAPGGPLLLGLDNGRPLFALDASVLDEQSAVRANEPAPPAPSPPAAPRPGPHAPPALGLTSPSGAQPALSPAREGALVPVRQDGLVAFREARLVSLREAGAWLAQTEGGLAAYLVALLNWHRSHRFCANCGSPTEVNHAGYSRHCPSCDRTHFPRTDPVVIMSVSCGDRLLLGRRAGWDEPRYSVLAGFVSPGESAEEAVLREVREESGIVARDPEFVASQPWPFPASLMLGFAAVADGGEPAVGDQELQDVRWFDLGAVRDGLSGRNAKLQLPPPIAIARALIERWVAEQQG